MTATRTISFQFSGLNLNIIKRTALQKYLGQAIEYGIMTVAPGMTFIQII